MRNGRTEKKEEKEEDEEEEDSFCGVCKELVGGMTSLCGAEEGGADFSSKREVFSFIFFSLVGKRREEWVRKENDV
jgi:hypothetical protein